MKKIIVEIRGREAAALGDDGNVENIRNRDYQVGDVIQVREHASTGKRYVRWAVSVAAMFVLFTVGAFAYTTPVGYVSMDVNPSIIYEINTFDRVLKIQAGNDDKKTEALVQELELLGLENMNIQKAVRITTKKLIAEGYFDDDDEDNGILVSTGSDNPDKAEKLAERLRLRIRESLEQEGKMAEVQAEAVGLARVLEAKELGVTPGKLNLVQKLIAIDVEDDIDDDAQEEWLEKPVKEINKAIRESRKAQQDKGQGNGKDNSDLNSENVDDADDTDDGTAVNKSSDDDDDDVDNDSDDDVDTDDSGNGSGNTVREQSGQPKQNGGN